MAGGGRLKWRMRERVNDGLRLSIRRLATTDGENENRR